MTVTVTVPDDAWIDHGQPGMLHATLHLAGSGALLHLDALQVTPDGVVVQLAEHHENAETLDKLYALASPGGPFETTTINGHPHVVYATPFS